MDTPVVLQVGDVQRLSRVIRHDPPQRRRAPRYRCPPATVGRLQLLDEGCSIICEADNLSATGIRLFSPYAVKKGGDVLIRLQVPSTNSDLTLAGSVVHCTPAIHGAWAVGCQFHHRLAADLLDALLD
jgi:PilZ domain